MINSLSSPFFIIFFVFILFSVFVPFTLRIEANNLRDNKIIQLELIVLVLYRLKFIHWKKNVTGLDVLQKIVNLASHKPEQEKEQKSDFFEKIGKDLVVHCTKVFIKRISFHLFKLQLRLGTGDAAWTAILTGFIHAVSYFIAQKINGLRQNVVFATSPSFLRKELLVHLQLGFSINAFSMILIVFDCSKTFLSLTYHYYRRRNKCQIDLYRV